MKIAHLSKPWLPVPSPKYGAIEKMVASLIESKSNQINQSFLFAPKGSTLNSKNSSIISLYEKGMGDMGLDRNTELAQAMHCVKESLRLKVDLIHAHSVDPFLAIAPFISTPSIFTFYSNPTPANKILSKMVSNKTVFTFLSKSHQKSFPWIKNREIIYFGLDANSFPFETNKQNYLAFVGSISDKKGIIESIQIAKKAKLTLKIAAKIKDEDYQFYKDDVERIITKTPNVEFIGEVDDIQRNNILKSAKCLLFPIKWKEPFGMVMIESMITGTPVIAFNNGSVPEIVNDGITGYIVENVSQAVKCISKLDKINPINCRKHVVENFNIETTAGKFNKLYQNVLKR